MFKVLKFIVISVVCLIIMGASVLYGFSSLFAPPNMDETLIPDAASQFYDINGNAIYTTLSEDAEYLLLLIRFLSMCSVPLLLLKIIASMNTVVLTTAAQHVLCFLH